jgi:FixJ family two-component response regulator
MAATVLLLDDDIDLLDSVGDLLENVARRTVLKARSVAELIAHGEAALGCELAILDINLGAGRPSGLDALRWLTEQRFAGRTVFLTGHARTFPLVEEARRERQDIEVLSKPISGAELLGLLEPK